LLRGLESAVTRFAGKLALRSLQREDERGQVDHLDPEWNRDDEHEQHPCDPQPDAGRPPPDEEEPDRSEEQRSVVGNRGRVRVSHRDRNFRADVRPRVRRSRRE